MAEPIERFIADLASNGKSPHTLRGYRADLVQLAAYYKGGTSDINSDVLRGFFASTNHQAPATQARKQASVSAFIGWCCRERLLRSNPMADIERVVARGWSGRARLNGGNGGINGANGAAHGTANGVAHGAANRAVNGTANGSGFTSQNGHGRSGNGVARNGLASNGSELYRGQLSHLVGTNRAAESSARTIGLGGETGTTERVRGGLVGKAVRVLTVLANEARPCGLTEIASRAPVPKATAYRLLNSLCEHGMVARSGVRYVLGDQLARLAATAQLHSDAWRGVAVPYLLELFQVSGGVVSLGVLVDGQVRYVEQLYGHRAPRTPSRAKQVAPAHCTAIGKLLLAHVGERRSAQLTEGPLPALTPYTISNPRALQVELAGIRKTALAFARQEYVRGLVCVAVPVLGHDGQVLAALAVGDDVSRFSVDRAVRQVRRTSLALSVTLRRSGVWRAEDLQ